MAGQGWEFWLGLALCGNRTPWGCCLFHTAFSAWPCRHVWEPLGSSALRRDGEPIARSHRNLTRRKDAVPLGNRLSRPQNQQVARRSTFPSERDQGGHGAVGFHISWEISDLIHVYQQALLILVTFCGTFGLVCLTFPSGWVNIAFPSISK